MREELCYVREKLDGKSEALEQAKQRRVQELDDDVTILHQRVAELELEVAGSVDELQRSVRTYSEKSEECNAFERENASLVEQIKSLKRQLADLELISNESATSNGRQSAEFDDKISELKRQCEEVEVANAALQVQLDEQAAALDDAKRTAAELEIDNGTLTNTIRELKASVQQPIPEDVSATLDHSTPFKAARRLSRSADGDTAVASSIRMIVDSPTALSPVEPKLSRAHSNVTVMALPQGKYVLPASVEESMVSLRAQQQVQERFLLDPVGSVQVSAINALRSNDVETLKQEIEELLSRYVALKSANSNLLQKMQALKGNIQVCCRTRPPHSQELLNNARICVDTSSENELAWFDKRASIWKSFAFDRVWPMDAMQADIFVDVEPLALSVVDGYNACILAFGQTGSGKTWTMNGYGDQYGVSYRTLHKIFEQLHFRRSQRFLETERSKPYHQRRRSSTASTVSIDAAASDNVLAVVEKGGAEDSDFADEDDNGNNPPEFEFSVSVAMLEIYNEMVRDLLSPAAIGHEGHGLDIRQTPEGGVGVPGLTSESVCGIEDVMKVFARGSVNRATMTTNLNEHSSRSHSILIVDVTTCNKGGAPVCGKLYLVDLAGSERVEKSGVTGVAMKEAQHINKSLSALGDVMEALDSKAKHVPYRNSKLTYLLQDSLGGNARTMMIVTICPTEDSSDETLFALQFATRVRRIQLGTAHKNVSAKNLEETVKALKLELKEAKKKKSKIEESLNDVKKEQKRTADRAAGHLEAKLRALEDMKKSADLQVQTLQKSNADMTSKLQEERNDRATVAHDLEIANKSLKKTHEQIKTLSREKEQVQERLREKEREISATSMSDGLMERKSINAVAKSTTSRVLKRPSVTSASTAPVKPVVDIFEKPHATSNRDSLNSVDDKPTAIDSIEGSPRETIRRSASDERASLSSPITRLIKEEALVGGGAEKESAFDDSIGASPPPKKATGIPRIPARRPSERSADMEASASSTTSQLIPRYPPAAIMNQLL